MAHFAKLDSNNTVVEVVRVNNEVILKADGTESELKGKQFLNNLLGSATWVQTSYNGNFRNCMAGIGYTYDSERDAFIMPKPYPSYLLNEDTLLYEAPIAHPTDGTVCQWDEENQEWNNCFTIPTE
tara:strand:- start:346 stop:723 length:378 start_codon:yes stop_codon:yes gene_type:complete